MISVQKRVFQKSSMTNISISTPSNQIPTIPSSSPLHSAFAKTASSIPSPTPRTVPCPQTSSRSSLTAIAFLTVGYLPGKENLLKVPCGHPFFREQALLLISISWSESEALTGDIRRLCGARQSTSAQKSRIQQKWPRL